MTPKRAAARPLTISLPASEMTSDREKMDRAQYSNAPNLMATAARYGAMMIRAIRPKMVPRNEKKMPVPSALAPSPLRAMGAPSKAVTIEAGVPGMFSRIEETRPPEIPPMYRAISRAMARLSLIAKVMGRQIVTAMVAVRPGMAPKMVPIRVPTATRTTLNGSLRTMEKPSINIICTFLL